MSPPRTLAIVPARNEEAAIGGVVDGIRAFDPSFDVLVVDDASSDATAAAAAARGAAVVSLPFNLGIGGAVQTGFKYALEHGYDRAVRLDGDGQHAPEELAQLLGPLDRDEADIVAGSRFAAADGSPGHRPAFARRVGIAFFAKLVSFLTGQRVTDTTSGFQALNHLGIELFAHDYPNDYPEVEAIVLAHKHRLRRVEVPVRMHDRVHGASSITFLASVYYMLKVTLALLVAMFRKYATPDDVRSRA